MLVLHLVSVPLYERMFRPTQDMLHIVLLIIYMPYDTQKQKHLESLICMHVSCYVCMCAFEFRHTYCTSACKRKEEGI